MNKGKNYNRYNIGSENELTNLQLVNKICKILDKKLPKKIHIKNRLVSFQIDQVMILDIQLIQIKSKKK